MKVYSVSHNGIILGGYSIVVADDEAEARQMMTEELKAEKLTPTIYSITEINPQDKGVTLIWNGDY